MKKIFIFLCFLITYSNAIASTLDEGLLEQDSIRMSYTGDEVVIRAFKSNDNVQLSPISATVLSERDIKESNLTNLKDFSGFIPNLYMPDYGSKMISPVYIRGIGSRINAPSVGLYVDGVPYFDRSTFDFNIADIERIEVLRGPQGTIYGRNTMGGLINVYTKSPFKYKETNVGLTAANYNTYQADASHYGNINNTFGYSLAGSYLHTGGYITNQYTQKRANPMDALATRMRLSWRPSARFMMHLTSAYEYSDQDGYPYANYTDSTNTVGAVNYNSPSYYRRNMSTTGLHAQYHTKTLEFNSQSSFQYFDGKQGLDQDFLPQNLYYVLFNQRQRMYSQEFNIKSKGSKNYEWTVGAFGFYQDFETNNKIHYLDVRFIPVPPPMPSFRAKNIDLQDVDTPSRGFAFFHQSTFNNILTKGLSATVGVRYDWEEIKAHTVFTSIDTLNVYHETKNKREKNKYVQITPKASLQYRFANDEIVYASVTKGYKSGGFNNTAQTEETFTFKPEYSVSYEVGTKGSYFDKLLYTEVSLFYINWRNQQVSQYQQAQGYLLRNAGKSESKGVEITTQINPFENFNLQLNYGYTHATFKKYVYNDKVDYSGNYLPMVPRHTFSAMANYALELKNKTLLDKVVFNAQYTGLGKLYWREDNIASQNFYGTVNGSVSFVKKDISVELWAKNITDQDYVSYYFLSQGGSFVQPGKPFTCGVNLNVKF
ncbi:MAG: hypothetical protein RL662_1260 [Bacteroidota bacterium]|jgi:outer membrane receptor protein involved in Fe transport